MSNAKIFQTGAQRLERANVWGEVPDFTSHVLKGFPYLDMPLEVSFETIKNNSVNGGAFDFSDVHVATKSENPYSFVDQFSGDINENMLWMWGFCINTKVAVYLQNLTDTATADVGDEYTNSAGQTLELVRIESYKDTEFNTRNLFVFSVTAPTVDETVVATTDETLTASLGDDIITQIGFGSMFEHLFELPQTRKRRNFTTDEIASLGTYYNVADKRSLMMTFAKKYESYNLISPNVMCESFSVKYAPASMIEVSASTIGFRPFAKASDDVDFPISFDMSCALKSNDNVVNFYQTQIEIGTVAGGKYTDAVNDVASEDVTDMDFEVSVPLQRQQNTGTGLYIDEPWIEGKYQFTGKMTIGRHAGTKFQDLRNNQSHLFARISSHYGGYMQEVMIKDFKLKKAGADGSDIAMEPIELNISATCNGNPFDAYVTGETSNSPIVMRTRDFSGVNPSTGRDSTGTFI